MKHYTSTLASTAVAVFGLVAAAHILHPGNYEAQPRPVRAPVAIAPAVTAWVDPPADRHVAAASPNRPTDAPGPAISSDLLVPRMMAALPPGKTMAPTLASAIAAPPERVRRAAATQATHRHKLAQRPVRTRQATLDRETITAQPAALRTETSEPNTKIDPIGDLIRGLGFGGEG